MKTENAQLMKMARESLTNKWGIAIAAMLIYMLITAGIQFIHIAGPIVSLILTGPMALGITIFSLNISRNQEARIEQVFEGFNNFGNAIGAYLLMLLFTLLWMLLLIVPGIIAALSYSLTFYILVDNKEIGPMDAIDKSKQMMDGNKWKLFCLFLRFLGWFLLCILTAGIGFLWLFPYMQVSMAKFYDDVKANQAVA